MAFPTGWGRRQPITIDPLEVDETLAGYPFLITLDHLDDEVVDAGTNSALNGGGDVRFTSDESGLNQLAVDLVDFATNATPASRACEIHVKVGSVSATVDTTIYIWYKKSGEVQPAATDTYGSEAVWSDYEVISHNGGSADSTGNTTPTKIGSPTSTNGKFTDATDYGSHLDDWYYRSIVANSSVFTIQSWNYIDVKSTDASGQGLASLTGGSGRVALAADNSPDNWGAWDTTNSWMRASPAQVQEIAVWRSAALVYNSTTDRRLFYEGQRVALDSTVSNTPGSKTTFEMGGSGSLPESWDGKLCETRLSYSPISDNWLSSEWNNQSSPATFASAGTPVSPVGGLSIPVAAYHYNHSLRG